MTQTTSEGASRTGTCPAGGDCPVMGKCPGCRVRGARRTATQIADGTPAAPDPMLEEFTRLNAAWLAQQATNRDLWTALVTITGHYDARSEIYTNDADLAEAMAGIARQALNPKRGLQ